MLPLCATDTLGQVEEGRGPACTQVQLRGSSRGHQPCPLRHLPLGWSSHTGSNFDKGPPPGPQPNSPRPSAGLPLPQACGLGRQPVWSPDLLCGCKPPCSPPQSCVANELTRHEGPHQQDAPGPALPFRPRPSTCSRPALPDPHGAGHTCSGICLIHTDHYPFLHQVPEDPASAAGQSAQTQGLGGPSALGRPFPTIPFGGMHALANLPH